MTKPTPLSLLQNDRFAAYNNIKLITMEPGHAIAQMQVFEHHLNGVDIVQGGALFTLADFAFAAAANAGGIITVSIGASITFFKSAKGRLITAEATELASGSKICTINVDLFDEDQTLIARFTGTGYKKGSGTAKTDSHK